MKRMVTLLLIVSAAGVTACSKSDEAAAPAPAVAEAPPAPATAEPVSENAPAETAPIVPEAISAGVVAPAAPQAPESKEAAPAPAPVPAAPATPPAVADLGHGQKIYRQACAFCHDRGVAGAPKTGDAAAWSVRLAQGMDTLYSVAIHGKGAMPAKGGNPSLSEADVMAAVDYMAAQSR